MIVIRSQLFNCSGIAAGLADLQNILQLLQFCHRIFKDKCTCFMVSVILTPIRFVDNRETPPAKALYYLRESLGQQQVIRMNVERHGRVFSIWYGFIGYPIVYNMRYIQCIAYRSYYVCKPIKDVLYFFVINKKIISGLARAAACTGSEDGNYSLGN